MKDTLLQILILTLILFSFGAEYQVKTIASAEHYPEVKLILNVRDARSYEGIYGLSKDEFKVVENGFVQTINSFKQKAKGKVLPIDIVFIFDETGSMSDEITAVKDNSYQFSENLKKLNMDYRLGLITFSDKIEKKYDFTSDVEQFKQRLGAIRATGGGDTPENALAGINQALKMNFREGAEVVFILITDAPYHVNNAVTPLKLLPLAKEMKINNIRLFPIAIPNERYEWMAQETDGAFFKITTSFSKILDELAVKLTSQYVLTYITNNTAFDNTTRTVEVSTEKSNKGTVTYKSASNISVSSVLTERNRPADAYAATNMLDGNKATAWNEGAIGSGIGEWIRFGFDTPKKLKALKIIGGYAKTERIYYANNRVKKLKLHFSDGKSTIITLKDIMDYQTITIDRELPTTFIRLEILEVYKGKKYDDTAISELEFQFRS